MNSETERRITRLFAGRAASLRLFRLVDDYIERLGPVEVVPRKTQVGFRRARMFAWVWLPQMWIKKQPESSITLSFSMDHRVEDPRIKASLEPYPGRFTHHVVITRASKLDTKVKRWLHTAYALAGRTGRRSRLT